MERIIPESVVEKIFNLILGLENFNPGLELIAF